VGQELLNVISPLGVEANLRALEELSAGDIAERASLSSKLEQLAYEAKKAFEQCDAVDARNRLAASELERRWNEKLEEIEAVKQRLPVWMENDIRCLLKRRTKFVRWAITLLKSWRVIIALRRSRR
jgi:hypothetical protein